MLDSDEFLARRAVPSGAVREGNARILEACVRHALPRGTLKENNMKTKGEGRLAQREHIGALRVRLAVLAKGEEALRDELSRSTTFQAIRSLAWNPPKMPQAELDEMKDRLALRLGREKSDLFRSLEYVLQERSQASKALSSLQARDHED
jgi:hypothetical protein